MVMTVQRVLPWRRERRLPEVALEPVLEAFTGPNRRANQEMIVKAFEMATEAHAPQRRKSGEPYITHPIAVARIVASLGVDVETVAAALLHHAAQHLRVIHDVLVKRGGAGAFGPHDEVRRLLAFTGAQGVGPTPQRVASATGDRRQE